MMVTKELLDTLCVIAEEAGRATMEEYESDGLEAAFPGVYI